MFGSGCPSFNMPESGSFTCVSTYAPTILCPSAYRTSVSGASTSTMCEYNHPVCPCESRASHQSSITGGGTTAASPSVLSSAATGPFAASPLAAVTFGRVARASSCSLSPSASSTKCSVSRPGATCIYTSSRTLAFRRLHLHIVPSVVEHGQLLAVGHCSGAVRNRRHAVDQVRLLHGDINIFIRRLAVEARTPT